MSISSLDSYHINEEKNTFYFFTEIKIFKKLPFLYLQINFHLKSILLCCCIYLSVYRAIILYDFYVRFSNKTRLNQEQNVIL